MTRKKPGLASPALLLAFVSCFSLSQAALAAPCTEQVEALRIALEGGCDSSKACDGLSHKLDNANHKLEQGKVRHAERRLADFVSVVEVVAPSAYDEVLAVYYSEAICVAGGGTTDDPFDGQMF